MQKMSSVCYFCWWHAREGIPGRTREFESNHSRNNILHVRGWISGRIAIAVAILYSCTIYRAQPTFPYGTGSRTGIWHRALGWNIKSRARIFPSANMWTILRHPCDSPPPSFSHRIYDNIWCHTKENESRIKSRDIRVKNRDWKKTGPKWGDWKWPTYKTTQ